MDTTIHILYMMRKSVQLFIVKFEVLKALVSLNFKKM